MAQTPCIDRRPIENRWEPYSHRLSSVRTYSGTVIKALAALASNP